MENGAKIFRQPCSYETVDNIMTFRPGITKSHPSVFPILKKIWKIHVSSNIIVGNSRAGLTRSKFPVVRWSSEDPSSRIIVAQFPFKAAHRIHSSVPSLTLSCRKFVPSPDDVLKEVWESTDSQKMVIDYQPYACVGGIVFLF